MKLRIAIWAAVGVLVAGGWAVYALLTFPNPIGPSEPAVWNLALITQPIVFATFHSGIGINLFWVVLANAATYALVGLIVEALRRQLKRGSMLGGGMP